MSTISSRILNLLVNETHVGQYDAPDVLPLVQKIRLEDLDLLEKNIPVLRQHVIAVHEALEVQAEQQRKATRKRLEDFLKTNGDLGITDVDTLITTLSGEPETAPTKTKAKSKYVNESYELIIPLPSDGQDIKRETFTIYNTSKLPAKVLNSESYKHAIASDPSLEDIEALLRKYSEHDYAKKKPINAKYGKHTFHLGKAGKVPAYAKKHFEDFAKKHAGATVDEFRAYAHDNYKSV